MGLTSVKLVLRRNADSKESRLVEALFDSGAIYSLVESKILKALGVRATRNVEFVLADGTKISRRVGDAQFSFEESTGAAPVIFGEKGDENLLGVTTLEALGLMLDPLKRTLRPMRMLLMRAGKSRRTEAPACLLPND